MADSAAAAAAVQDEEQRKAGVPSLTVEEARRVLSEFWTEEQWGGGGGGGGEAELHSQVSYDDCNFRVGTSATLKIHNAVESAAGSILDAQDAVMRYLTARGFPVPDVIAPKAGSTVEIQLEQPKSSAVLTHRVRLLTYLPGDVLASASVQSPRLLQSVGRMVGRMTKLLEGFDHPALSRVHIWDSQRLLLLRSFVSSVRDPARRALADAILSDFESVVVPVAPQLPLGTVHHDVNDQNVLITRRAAGGGESSNGDDDDEEYQVKGLIDFGDIVRTWRVCEVASCCGYLALGKDDPILAMRSVLQGYLQEQPLSPVELDVLPLLICARLLCSVVMSSYSFAQNPDNPYLLLTQEPGWKVLQLIRARTSAEFLRLITADPT